jgi:hypothetical protein
MIHCSDGFDPLLPRPMSFHRFREVDGERQFAILFDVRGRGTTWLADLRAGDEITVFGPLGRGYDVKKDAQNLLLVAGGLGVAGVMPLVDEAVSSGRAVTLLHGARTENLLFPRNLLPTDVEFVAAQRTDRPGAWPRDGVDGGAAAVGGPGVRLRAQPDVRGDGTGRPGGEESQTGPGAAGGADGLRDGRVLRVRGVHAEGCEARLP